MKKINFILVLCFLIIAAVDTSALVDDWEFEQSEYNYRASSYPPDFGDVMPDFLPWLIPFALLLGGVIAWWVIGKDLNPKQIHQRAFWTMLCSLPFLFVLSLMMTTYRDMFGWMFVSIPVVFIGYAIWSSRYKVTHNLQRKSAIFVTFTVLVIAVVVLGIGLGFVRNQFSGMESRLGSVSMSKGMQMDAMAESNIGFSTGGAKDINNFRENVENGYLPMVTDVTYEGLFYDYYFDTGQTETCNELFCPSYSSAVTKDPLSGEEEYYLQVGLNSGIKESDFKRKKLNLVVVLDISGSMSSPFNRYYYDRFSSGKNEEPEGDFNTPKMEIANEAVVELLGHLNDDDRFGMVLFESQGFLAKPMSLIGETDMDELEDHILDVRPQGGTNFAAGYRIGTELLEEFDDVDQAEYENRIIFLTDAMPNLGETRSDGLFGMTESNADDQIYTTFIGIGVDFNTELIEEITKVRGANYYSVHSSDEFTERMDEGFEYMVTPLVFDLKLELEADGFEIEKVYGSPEADASTGELMYVNTLFPSKTEGGQTKGGVVILKLKKVSDDAKLTLTASYENRLGIEMETEADVRFTGKDAEHFDNLGIRKAILLSRYASLLKDWIIDERSHYQDPVPYKPMVTYEDGIIVPPLEPMLGRWERQSIQLTVSEHYEDIFEDFRVHFESEIKELDDETLEQEIDILKMLD